MTWIIDQAVEVFKALPSYLEKSIQITSKLHVDAALTNIEPCLIVEFGACMGHGINKMPTTYATQNGSRDAVTSGASHEAPQYVEFPVNIILEQDGQQGELFFGRLQLASMCAARYLYKGAYVNVPIASIENTYTNISTGEDVTFSFSGGNAVLNITEVDTGTAIEFENPDENGGMNTKFMQTFSGTYKFKVSKQIYQDLRLNT